jgi:membrane protein DedA with SNARE-associated domain
VLYDLAGSVAYATVFVVVGRLFSDEVDRILQWIGHRRAVVLVVPVAIVVILGYRLWRRRRDGRARAAALCGPAEPERNRTLR